MRVVLVTALAACASRVQAPPPAPPSRTHVDDAVATCELAAHGARCHAVNPGNNYAIACVEVRVGVRRTGAMYASRARTCSAVIQPRASIDLEVPVAALPADACSAAGACRLLVTTGDGAAARVIAFARELEAGAREVGGRPRLSECEAVRRAWLASDGFPSYRKYLGDPELVALVCLEMARETFECARAATAEADLERCDP